MLVNQPKALNRRAAVSCLLRDRGNAIVVTSLGNPTFDVSAAGDTPLNFYLWGAMGGAAMVGLGMAIAHARLGLRMFRRSIPRRNLKSLHRDFFQQKSCYFLRSGYQPTRILFRCRRVTGLICAAGSAKQCLEPLLQNKEGS